MPENDILEDIPLEELSLLTNHLKSRLGRADSTFMVNVLKNAIDWLTRFPSNSYVTVMAPNGDWNTHCTFVADFNIPHLTTLIIFSLQASNEELTNALLTTKRINWDNLTLFAMVTDHNHPVVYKVAKEFNLLLHDENPPCYMFRIDTEEALKFDNSWPENMSVEKLDTSHAKIVNNEWPHKYDGSDTYIEATLVRNDSVGVFVGETKELASWAFINFVGALASLQTLPEHKRKGYGAIVTKAMAARMAAKGMDPYGTVLTNNTASKKLFYGLGFKPQSQQATFFEIIPKKK